MAKLNQYEQQTAFQAPRADAQAFGGGVAQALGQAGEVAMDLGLQMKRREDVIDRVQRLTDFDTMAQQALTAVNDTEDIAKKSTVDGYAQALRQKSGEILNQHTGTAASKAELQAQLTNQVGQYIKSANAAQIKAQQQFIGRRIEQSANALAASGAFAPQMLPQLFEQFDSELGTYADAMSPEQAAAYKEAGRSQIAMGAIDKLQQEGQWQSAKAMMKNPEIVKYLAPAAARKFAIDIAVDERKSELETKRQDNNVARLAQVAKRNLTPEEVIRARSLPPKKDMTIADKITEYELVTGRPAPQAVVDELFNVDNGIGGGAFGNSLQGRALNFVTEKAPAYAAGLLTPEERRTYEAFYAEAYKPVLRQDPATGMMTEITPTVPQFVQQAIRQGQGAGGAPMGGGGAGRPPPGSLVQYTDPTGRVIGRARVDANGNFSIMDQNPQPEASAASGGAQQPASLAQGIPSTPAAPGQDGRTVWERRGSIAGPVAAAGAMANRVPGVGPMVAGAVMGEEQARQLEADRTFVDNASRDLIRILQNNPRMAEGERQAIEKEISIGPEVFRSQESYEAKLIGVAQSLTKRKLDAQRSMASGAISLDERKAAMDRVAAIDNFMQNLGIPPVVSSEQEVQALPPGTVFMDAKGNEYRKR